MFQENQEVTRVVQEMASLACRELFEAYGVGLKPTVSSPHDLAEVLYCGVMGFVGQGVRGSCLLAASQAPLEASRPAEGPVRDWIGELTNQLVGRMKAKLLLRGAGVVMTTPIVLRGEHLAPLPRKNMPPIAFAAQSGLVLLWVELEVDDDFVLKAESEHPESVVVTEPLFF